MTTLFPETIFKSKPRFKNWVILLKTKLRKDEIEEKILL